VQTPPTLRHRDCRPGTLVAGVGNPSHPGCVDGVVDRVEDAVLAGGTDVVPRTGQRGRGPDQSACGVGDDLHVEAVALVCGCQKLCTLHAVLLMLAEQSAEPVVAPGGVHLACRALPEWS
jgi:hypothetical protein